MVLVASFVIRDRGLTRDDNIFIDGVVDIFCLYCMAWSLSFSFCISLRVTVGQTLVLLIALMMGAPLLCSRALVLDLTSEAKSTTRALVH